MRTKAASSNYVAQAASTWPRAVGARLCEAPNSWYASLVGALLLVRAITDQYTLRMRRFRAANHAGIALFIEVRGTLSVKHAAHRAVFFVRSYCPSIAARGPQGFIYLPR